MAPTDQGSTPWHRFNESLFVSDDIQRYLLWLRRFEPSGDEAGDIERLLLESGAMEILAKARESGGNLIAFATGILSNHKEELARLSEGLPPRWLQPYDRDRVPLYQEMVQLEVEVLRRILVQMT
jgi:hypothetical protein